jgi:hypothetical protein
MFRKIPWGKMLRSWWGRSLAGAVLGGLLMAFANINSGPAFLIGMAVGAVTLFLLGRLR